MKQRLLYPLLKIFFRLLYGAFAWTYDWVAAAVSLGMWKGWVLSVLPYLDGERTLELGHGPGHLQQALCRAGRNPFGLDGSPQMSRLARTRLTRKGCYVRLARGHAQRLPFAQGSFDRVAATFPTEYIVDADTLAEIWRVLAPQGRLIVLPVAWITGENWPHRLAASLFRITGQAAEWDDRFLQPLRQAGFEVHLEPIAQRNSRLVIIVARKPE
ncbi:MAG: class I SAM-dependent methyltransferase [Chloroflexota bacterium]